LVHRIRSTIGYILRAALVLFVFGGIPGSALRPPSDLADWAKLDGVPEAAKAALTIRARDLDEAPIAQATVRIFAVTEAKVVLVRTTETAENGDVTIAGVPLAEVWVLVDKDAYARASSHAVLGVDGRTIELHLKEEVPHIVQVVDDKGAPVVADVIVSAGDVVPIGARTGPDGLVSVRHLSEPPWTIRVRAPGFDEVSVRVHEETERTKVVLGKLGGLLVEILLPSGEPAVRAQLAIAGPQLWPPQVTSSDERGHVRIASLASGSYALRATQGSLVSSSDLLVAIDKGVDQSVILKLEQGQMLSVKVTNGVMEGAEPIADARVVLAEGGLSPFPLEGKTGGDGRVTLGPFARGGAAMSVSADGFVPRGAMAVPEPAPVEFRVGLSRAGTLLGRVVDGRGQPIDGVTLEVIGTDATGGPIADDPRRSLFQAVHFDAMLSGPRALVSAGELGVMPGPVPGIPRVGVSPSVAANSHASTRGSPSADPWVSRSDGTFRLQPVTPGRVRLFARHPQYVEAMSEVVALAPDGEAKVEVVMRGGATLEGTVNDSRGRPVARARVVAAATEGSYERSTYTATDGTFAFASVPDELVLTAYAPDENETSVRARVSVAEGGKKVVVLVLPESRAALAVRVTDDRGYALEAAQVSALSLDPNTPLRTTAFTDKQGDAALRGAKGVPLRVRVVAPRHAPKVVTTDAKVDQLRVELDPSETATGEVRSRRTGDRVARAQVTLASESGVFSAETGADGVYTIAGIGAGPAQLRVRAAGYVTDLKTVTIVATAHRRPQTLPRLELAEEGLVEGEVVDERGQPVFGARVARGHAPTYIVNKVNHGLAVADERGRFKLAELPEGRATLEAYAPDVGRGTNADVKVVAGRTTFGVRIVLHPTAERGYDPAGAGSVAVTLGESDAQEVVVMSVAAASEAERGGLASGDVIEEVDGVRVAAIADARKRLSGPISNDVLITLERGGKRLRLRVARESVRR
jgi:protocatechuate 3,4-dioxygenase beta subunit